MKSSAKGVPQSFSNFEEFYPFYISQHSNQANMRLHFIGTTLAFLIVAYSFLTFQFKTALYAPIAGYAFAWVGHFFFEKNKPATFKYPFLSLRGDMRLWYEIATGKRAF